MLSLSRRSEDEDRWWIENYQIIQCRGCESPTFRYERIDPDSEQYDEVKGESYLASKEVLYPSRNTRPELEKTVFLPFPIQIIYREVLRALAANTPVLAAIGLGTIIEAACKGLGEAARPRPMINSLVTKGKLRAEEAEILHSLYDARNASAHETRAFKKEELLHALTMVEHILTTIYLLPHHRDDLPSGAD